METKVKSTYGVNHAARIFGTVLLALMLAACGGGGSSSGADTSGGNTSGGNTGGGNTGGYTAPANLGQVSVTGSGAAQYATTFTPASLQPITSGSSTSFKWIDTNSLTVMVAGMTVSATNGNQQWQQLPASSAELSFDAVAGSITFNNLTTTSATGGATGALTLNGTLNIAPLNSGPVTIAGADTAHAGSGFNSPVATFKSANGMEDYGWLDARGTGMVMSKVVADGSYMLIFSGLGGSSFVNMGASAAAIGITVDTAAKTATFSNTSLMNTLNGNTIILNGTLSLP